MMAYSDASCPPHAARLGVAGLGVMLAGQPIARIEQVLSLQHAELQAARLAVEQAPHGVQLELHLDCQNALTCLDDPGVARPAYRSLAQSILALAESREIDLQVRHIRGSRNPAHQVARQALHHPGRELSWPHQVGRTLRFDVRPEKIHVRGAGLNLRLAQDGWVGLQVLTQVVALLPEATTIRVRGLGPYIAFLWSTPEQADPKNAALIQAAKQTLKTRCIQLVFAGPKE